MLFMRNKTTNTNCDILKNLNRAKLMKEFVDRTPERRCVFGFILWHWQI